MARIVFNLDELEGELSAEVRQLLVEISNSLVNNLKRESPVGATGDLRRSWQLFRTSDDEVVLGSRINYAQAVNDGSEPHEPNFGDIQVWARRVIGDESAAGPVFRKIKREGTEPNPYIDRAFEATLREFR
jgi:hypothetical protein